MRGRREELSDPELDRQLAVLEQLLECKVLGLVLQTDNGSLGLMSAADTARELCIGIAQALEDWAASAY